MVDAKQVGIVSGEDIRASRSPHGRGLRVSRWYTKPGQDPFSTVQWEKCTAKITNQDGSVVFEMKDVEAPTGWTQTAVDIAASKYFRKAGVPGTGRETSVRAMIKRVVDAIILAGTRAGGYFETPDDAQVLHDELCYMLVNQIAAFNSPVWFNCGLFENYGIKGDESGNWCWDQASDTIVQAPDAYSRPAISACFIVSVNDDLMDIAEHVKREMRIFRFGGGSGGNFSNLRGEGEPLSGGGTSSGVMSFLSVFDKSAGAIKSGGTTRRAAKMCVLDADHPDVEKFVEWKAREEDKVRALIAAGYSSDFNGEAYRTIDGQNANNSVSVTDDFMKAVVSGGDWNLIWRRSRQVAKTLKAKALFRKIAEATWKCADPGLQFSTRMNQWHTIPASGPIRASNPCCLDGRMLVDTSEGLIEIQRLEEMSRSGHPLPSAFAWDIGSNQPVLRPITRAWVAGETREMVEVTTQRGVTVRCTPEHRFLTYAGDYVEAKDLKPGIELRAGGEIRAGGEVRVRAGMLAAGGVISISSGASHAVLDAPDAPDCVDSVARVVLAEPAKVYDIEVPGTNNFAVRDASAPGVHTLVVHNSEYLSIDNTSCNLASLNLMKFVRFKDGVPVEFDVAAFEKTCVAFTMAMDILVDHASYPTREIAQNTHDYRQLGLGYANLGAAIMVLGMPYDSDEARAFAAGVTAVMSGAAYTTSAHIAGSKGPFAGYAKNAGYMNRVMFMHQDAVHEIKAKGQIAQDVVSHAAACWSEAVGVGESLGYRNSQCVVLAPTGTIGLLMDCDTTGVEPDFALVKGKKLAGGGYMKIPNRSVEAALGSLGYGVDARKAILEHIVETGTAEGAPGMSADHYATFDCSVSPRPDGRAIAPMGHVRMVAAVQPFLSGSASKTVNVPESTTVEEIERIYLEAWRLGLKCISIYRDNSKAAQVLSASGGKAGEKKEAAASLAAAAAQSPVAAVPAPIERRRLPKKRFGFTQEARISGHKVYVRTGEYEDGALGEIFIDTSKDGAAFRSLMNAFAIAVSLGLQHGVPLDAFVETFTFTKFEPSGPVSDHPNIKHATSIIDFIFRLLALEYRGRTDLVQVPPEQQVSDVGDVAEKIPHAKKVDVAKVVDDVQQAIKQLPPKAVSVAFQTAYDSVVIGAKKNGNGKHKKVAGSEFCFNCGGMTVRTGTCTTCMTCGTSGGCG